MRDLWRIEHFIYIRLLRKDLVDCCIRSLLESEGPGLWVEVRVLMSTMNECDHLGIWMIIWWF